MKKTIYLLNVDDFEPEITNLTYPLIYGYADKIGANVYPITERVFPDMPVTYEKLQIFDLAKTHRNDWNIYIDSDALIHPECPDYTEFITKDVVMHHGVDLASIRWRYDNYFRRDGRHIGSCNWFTIASDWCLDLWHPLDMSLEEALEYITPTPAEINSGVIDKEHLIDDFTLSRNIARYGLHVKTVIDLMKEVGLPGTNYFWHVYTVDRATKVTKMKEILAKWNLPVDSGVY